MNGHDIAVLNSEVVANDTVHSGTAVIKIIVGQDDEDSIFSLLALNEDSIASEELQSLHGVVGEGDNGVVIVDRVGHSAGLVSGKTVQGSSSGPNETDMSEFGFFFFLRIAVAVSSTWDKLISTAVKDREGVWTVLLLSSLLRRHHCNRSSVSECFQQVSRVLGQLTSGLP